MSLRQLQGRVQLAVSKVPGLYHILKWSRDAVRSTFGPGRLNRAVSEKAAQGKPINIIVGAGLAGHDPDWIPTDQQFLDLLDDSDWQQAFGEHRLDAILAEHVWEHLTPADGKQAAAQCYKYLKPGGRLRIAVPDANHPSPEYYEFVRPGGPGPGADDHKILYTYQTLGDMLSSLGFQAVPLEYCDEKGAFHHSDWSLADGHIMRRRGFTERNLPGENNYTSLIVDGIK